MPTSYYVAAVKQEDVPPPTPVQPQQAPAQPDPAQPDAVVETAVDS